VTGVKDGALVMNNDLTVLLTGQLPFIVIVSAILTAVVSIFLLWFYRRAVVRAMNALAGVSVESLDQSISSKAAAPENISFPAVSIVDLASDGGKDNHSNGLYLKAIRSVNQVTLAYALAGLVYALVFTVVKMIHAGDGFYPFRFMLLFSIYCWPVILTSILVNPTYLKRILGLYAALLIALGAIALFRNPGTLGAGELILLWLIMNGPATVLLLTFLNRKVRAVGPIVLVFMIIATAGGTVFFTLIGNSQNALHIFAALGAMLHLSTSIIVFFILLAGFVLFGVFGWIMLRFLGYKYQQKRMSEQSITIDAIYLLFCILGSIDSVFEGGGWFFSGLLAFALYKFTLHFAIKFFSRKDNRNSVGQRLLLLRVFSLGKRSERFFDAISTVWLRTGSISLIAGPDLATSTVEPHEFLDFMGGHLSRQFVQGETDLEQRIAGMDNRSDPDGRYRANEFFCRADTWQMAMQRLARGSDAVLMDLRSFSAKNRGCLYELQQLFNIISLRRLLFVIDESTDRVFLEMTIRDMWKTLLPYSPNANVSQPVVRCFSVRQGNHEETGKLLSILYNIKAAA